jgi:hypothetical protein
MRYGALCRNGPLSVNDTVRPTLGPVLAAILIVMVAIGNHFGIFHRAGCSATAARAIAAQFGDSHAKVVGSTSGEAQDNAAPGYRETCTVTLTGHFRVNGEPADRVAMTMYSDSTQLLNLEAWNRGRAFWWET